MPFGISLSVAIGISLLNLAALYFIARHTGEDWVIWMTIPMSFMIGWMVDSWWDD